MIDYRELTTRDELLLVQELEEHVWNMPAIPIHQTLTAVKNGGLMIGAFDEDRLIGFSYGFAGFDGKESYLCSHMLGIHPDYRSQKIGEQLKEKQRELALDKGYLWMKWTYDPLETRNGYLNLTKLGAICDTYFENCYGEMNDGLNKGLPTDRFEVHWFLPQKEEARDVGEATAVARIDTIGEWPVLVPELPEVLDQRSYAIPAPKDFQSLKRADPELALDWRMKSRELFTNLFAAGYCAVRLEQGEAWNSYILVRKSELGGHGK